MEVYVDDMLVKSLKTMNHVADLQEAFAVLQKYQMKLNPSKCAFGVVSSSDSRYRIPMVLVTDNWPQFASEQFKNFCERLMIEQRFTSVGHPQANGQVEVTNRILLQSFKKRVEDAKNTWVLELQNVLWAYRTTPRTVTGESPFNQEFGVEAIIPVEITIPSPRVKSYSERLNDELMRSSLDLVEETRENARIRVAAYQ
ncbi:uncharacterized protein LOC143850376 [Tasmannia lanceolata]|uniref:uncharacterized protein LOC143850376 n=1 Tax=Tasmannia lanceolata TaxID=3420 RepID=UPI00406375B9